jgi:mannose-1-phosphate guanylyltransferase
MHIFRRYPQSTVAVLPADHFIWDEHRFLAHVILAFRAVEQNPGKIVLLGIEPDRVEPEYGYIIPDRNPCDSELPGFHSVRAFVEKPDPHAARKLLDLGALWNTMVMVFNVETFLGFTRLVAPRLYRCFEKIWDAIGTSQEKFVTEDVYREIEPCNLSSDLLEAIASTHQSSLAVLPVNGVYWSDWGSAARILETVQHVRQSGMVDADFVLLSQELGLIS